MKQIQLETFRFKDEDEDEYEYVFFAYSQSIDSSESFILPFVTRIVNTLTFSEGGYTLSYIW